ncbi:MAG: hypothetical protein UT34_C0001G0172 [candidate division WS6 bacterium GW2011_GWF2_39_15]|uniref:Uncharacterized protein n=1 Tax=candidate division WS6 bacterium GW2011_GWF2_39_15 TaxID=1619100 RepID=A0A0G0QWX1_9BACT|nr:MAG: hypothetical protein UT34_C0001G0172 [candidate division WS6 bacterium GW2011_GWF2_39_15]
MDNEGLLFQNGLTGSQREYFFKHRSDKLAVFESQVYLCGPQTGLDEQQIQELTVSPDVLLEMLDLDSGEPDGKSLLDRLLPPHEDGTVISKRDENFFWLRVKKIGMFVDNNMIAPYQQSEFVPSPSQENILKNLALVFDRQIVRENNTCLVAQEFAHKFLENRSEYLSAAAIHHLKNNPVYLTWENLGAMMGGGYRLEDIFTLFNLYIRINMLAERIKEETDEYIKASLEQQREYWERKSDIFLKWMKDWEHIRVVFGLKPKELENYMCSEVPSINQDLLPSPVSE